MDTKTFSLGALTGLLLFQLLFAFVIKPKTVTDSQVNQAGLFIESESPTMIVRNKTYLTFADAVPVVAYYEHAHYEYHQLRYLHMLSKKTNFSDIIKNVLKTHPEFYKYDYFKQILLIEKELLLYLNDDFLKPYKVMINFQHLHQTCQKLGIYDKKRQKLANKHVKK